MEPWIIPIDTELVSFLLGTAHGKRGVNQRVWKLAKLRYPLTNVLSSFVVSLCLKKYVEVTLLTRVIPNSGNIGPVAPVTANIVVEKHRLKVGCSFAPIQAKVFDEIACNILAASVGHEAGLE